MVCILFTQGCLLRKTSVSLVLLVFRRPTFSRKPSDPLTFLRYQLTTGQMQFMLTHKRKRCHKPTVNQQVFHHVYSPFIQPTFRCFLNSALFYSALTGHTYTHTRTHLLEIRCRLSCFSEFLPLQNTRSATHTYMHTHCVFAGRLLPSGFPRRCWVWLHHPATLGAPLTPSLQPT